MGIGAFNAPTYILNLTPFLGKFLGEAPRAVAFRVDYGEAFWLIDGNLLVFQDAEAVRPTRVEILQERLDRYVEPATVTLPAMVGAGNGNVNGNITDVNGAFWTSVVHDVYVKTSVTTSTGRRSIHCSNILTSPTRRCTRPMAWINGLRAALMWKRRWQSVRCLMHILQTTQTSLIIQRRCKLYTSRSWKTTLWRVA